MLVHPQYQRRGIATMLLKWGFDRADQSNKLIYTESTPAGLPLYLASGFIKRAEETILDGHWTLTAVTRT